MNNGLPFDLASQQAEIQQRQQLAQALMQAGLQGAPQGQMVSGHYISPGILGALLPGMKMLAGQAMGNQATEASRGLSGQYNQALSQGLQQYMDTRATDPRKAMVQAMASGIGPLQDVGKAELQGMISGKGEEKFGHTPQVVMIQGKPTLALIGDRGTVKPVEGMSPATEYKATSGGQLYNPLSGQEGPYLGEKYGPTQAVNGEAIQFDTRSGKAHQVANRPAQTHVRVNASPVVMGQKAGMEKWAGLAGDTVKELSDTARASVKLLGTLNQLEASGQAGVFSGPTADAATFMAGLGQAIGVPVDTAKLANSQTFNAASISAWQDMVKQAGGNRGVVKEEAAKMMQMVPQLSQSPQGRKQITSFLRWAAETTINDAKKAQKEYGQALTTDDPTKFTFGLGETQLPRTEAMPAPAGAASTGGAATRSGW